MGMVSFPVTSTPASHQNSIKLGDTIAKCERSLLSVLLLVIILIDMKFISINIITNKRTDKSDHLHFAIVSPSFFFEVLHPVFIIILIRRYEHWMKYFEKETG